MALDYVYAPLEPQYISNAEVFPTTLSRYWQSPANLQFLRHDSYAKLGGSLITQVFCFRWRHKSSGVLVRRCSNLPCRTGLTIRARRNETQDFQHGNMYPGNQPNVAQIIPPDTRTGQLALNGDLHVIDKVLLPNPRAFCRAGDFEFYMGSAFSSVIASQQDQSGQVINNIVPRAFAYDFCDKLPCTYEIPGLYGRAGFRLSVEATVQFKHVLPLCDPWCDPTQYWWCIPCTGI